MRGATYCFSMIAQMQVPAVRHVHNALKQGNNAEPLINTASYVMGEFAKHVEVQDSDMSLSHMFRLLNPVD